MVGLGSIDQSAVIDETIRDILWRVRALSRSEDAIEVYDVVPVQREVVIRIPKLKPGPEVVLKAMQLDKTTAPAIERRFDAVTTPNVNTVVLPKPVVTV